MSILPGRLVDKEDILAKTTLEIYGQKTRVAIVRINPDDDRNVEIVPVNNLKKVTVDGKEKYLIVEIPEPNPEAIPPLATMLSEALATMPMEETDN